MLPILFCHASFFLITDLYFIIPAVTAQIFIPIAETRIPIGMPIKEANAEMETHPVIVEIKRSVQYNLELYKSFCAFLLINSFWFISSVNS